MGVTGLRSSFSLSLALHVILFLACAALLTQRAAEIPQKKYTYIELEPVKNRADDRNDSRLVQTEKTARAKEAAPDAFLGEQTQVVDRQTVSKEQNTVIGNKAAPVAKTKPKEKSEKIAKAKTAAPALKQLGIPIIPKADAPEYQEDVAKNTGILNPQEYLKGFKTGERTLLNTKEYVFYSYFQRIRQRLDWAWGQTLREKLTRLYRSGRMLASDREHTTKVLVTLNPKGSVTRVQVLEESGTRDLDDAAVRAFNEAGPFPNPPRGIVDASGTIQLRWDFVLRS